jgi:sodium-dependent dicarboxylate transporter 2/3/5
MKKILIAIIIAAAFGAIAYFFLGDIKKTIVISIIALMVTLWTNEAVPMGIVSLMPLILFPIFKIMPIKATAVNYSEPVIFLFLGGFMMAIAVEKLNLHKYLATRLLHIFPKTVTGLVYGICITSGFLSAVLSNTTVTLMLLPIVLMLTKNKKVTSQLLLALAFGASIGGVYTLVGTPPNLILLGFLQKYSLGTISFVKWMALMTPVVIPMFAIAPYLLAFPVRNETLEVSLIEKQKTTPQQKKLMTFLILLFMVLVLNSKIEPWYGGLGLDERAILLTAGLLMFLPGLNFLTWEDTKEIPFDIIYLFGAGFAIADAFAKCELVESFAVGLEGLTTLAPFIIILVIAVAVSLLTNVTSNTAVVSVALPVFLKLSEHVNFEQNMILVVVTVACSYAFMLPIGTPPNAIVMSSGHLKTGQMIRNGALVNLLGIGILTLAAYFFWG